MAVAALPPGKKSPIDSMRSKFRGLKNNIKSMSKTVIGIQTALQKANELKRKRLETIKENRIKQKDLQQKPAEEARLEKPNLMSSSFSNIKDSIKGSDLVIIHTEWNDFKSINFRNLVKGKKFIIYDMRNIYSPSKIINQGFKYYCIGR